MEAEDAEVPPPDGGWGWVIVVGAGINSMLQVGCILCLFVVLHPSNINVITPPSKASKHASLAAKV